MIVITDHRFAQLSNVAKRLKTHIKVHTNVTGDYVAKMVGVNVKNSNEICYGIGKTMEDALKKLAIDIIGKDLEHHIELNSKITTGDWLDNV